MGHQRFNLEHIAARAPFQNFFAAGLAPRGQEAIERARDQASLAKQTLANVKEQAVWTCMYEGMSIRAIATHLALPKSEVGRIVRRTSRTMDGRPQPQPVSDFFVDAWQEAREAVHSAWRTTSKERARTLTEMGLFR